MMSVTAEQKAFHLRKMRTRMNRIDQNKDGFVSREDYILMGEKVTAACSEMSNEKAETTRKEFLRIADQIGLIPGLKIPLEEAAEKASETILAMTPEQQKDTLKISSIMYDIIDTNGDGYISIPEFKEFFKILAPDLPEEKVASCFKTLDTNANDQISRDEFLVGAGDFMYGLDESPYATAFFGDLVD